jgi:hypothetical protein
MYREYVPRKFSAKSMALIGMADVICRQYANQGYTLTLRQLYYQFVSRDIIANQMSEYKRLASLINDARLAGLIDWSHLEDRTRNLQSLGHWDSPADILDSAASSYRLNMWENQEAYVEVWIEKDALIGVIERPCNLLDVPYFSCRGYTSQSEMWSASQRIIRKTNYGEKQAHIIHLGDHDPSGIDMSRDIDDRLNLFCDADGVVPPVIHRIALNMDQVREFNPPPNPAKLSDSRAVGYISRHGNESWELDALRPEVIDALIHSEVEQFIDAEQWEEDVARAQRGRDAIEDVAARFREEGY